MVYDRQLVADLRRAVLCVSAIAWAVLIVQPAGLGGLLLDSLCAPGQAAWLTPEWLAVTAGGWMLMIVAMMLPMTAPALARIRLGTFAAARRLAMAGFLAGYGLVWLIAGWVFKGLDVLLRNAFTSPAGLALGAAAVALIWQFSPAKQISLNRCHAHRAIAAQGWRSVRDALFFGLRHGGWCLCSCWALMLVLLCLPQGHLIGMVAALIVMHGERLDHPRLPAWQLRGLGALVQAVQREWAWRRRSWPAQRV